MIHASKNIVRVALSLLMAGGVGTAYADTAVLDNPQGGFPQETGEQLYNSICLGCHMAQAQGAEGAGVYPALADNPRLAAAGYPLYVVMYGQKAMPAFGGRLSDKQIAEVVNYVRTHFGNDYEGVSTEEDAAKLRTPGYDYVTLE